MASPNLRQDINESPTLLSPSRWAVLLLLFFASGASGLIYEIVWMRLLSLTFSVTVHAVTTVLCAFMAGLALGAAIAGRLAARLERPLFAYGLIEIVLGLVALVTPFVIFRLGPLYQALYDGLGGYGPGFSVARFLLAFLILLVPCTLMGTTLPLLSRAVVDRTDAVGRGAGGLYAVNTLGAVAGCVAAGFLLIPNLGLVRTSAVAACVSALVGVAAVYLGRYLTVPTDAAMPARSRAALEPARIDARFATVAIAISGFTALGYQVLWTRALEQYTHNSTYAYSAILATFLLGIAAGSAVAATLADRMRRPMLALGIVELVISASVVAALVLYANLDRLIPTLAASIGGLQTWNRVVALIFVEAGAILFVTTFLFGMTFPLVARIVVQDLNEVGKRIAGAYTANTAGSILGALLIGFFLLPALGMLGAFLTLVLLNAVVGLTLTWRAGPRTARVSIAAGAAALAALTAVLVPPRLFEESYVRRFGKLLFYREEVTDTVMVTDDKERGRMIRYGDGRGTAGTGTVKEDRMYAQIPLLLHPKPLDVLNICFGVGNSLSSVTTHPVEHIDSVELSPGVVDAAPFFADTNRDVLADPRIRRTTTDGRNFLLLTHNKYDIIRLDPPELHTAGIVNLYTREFYELARDRLKPGGIFSIWVNIVMTPLEDMRHLVRTLASVFPYVSIWHSPFYYSWVINGSMTPIDPDLERITEKMRDPKIQAELRSIGIEDPFQFLSHFVLAGDEVAEFAGPGPLVTDDRTMLDFSVPKSIDSAFGIANANTDSWLSETMDPNEGKGLAVKTFFRKIGEMNAFKRPVEPHLVNVEKAGFTPDQVRERMEAVKAAAAGQSATARVSSSK